MNKDLERLKGIPFQSYIGDNFPLYSETSYGQFIIVDNTGSENINGLTPNTYSVFIDNIHVASGYGFSSAEDLANNISRLEQCEENINNLLEITDNTDDIFNNLFDLRINARPNDNHFSTYNSYGFETSYTYFSITTIEESKKYNLNINKYNLNYINPIEIEYVKDDNENDITIVYKDDLFPLNIKLTSSSPENANLLKNKYDVKLNNETIIENYLNEIDIDNNNFKKYLIGFNNVYEKDLVVEYIFDRNNLNTLLSSYTIPNLLQWGEIVVNYPTDNLIDTIGVFGEDYEEGEDAVYSNIGMKLTNDINLGGYKTQNNYIIPGKLYTLTFSSGENFIYDYVITTSTLDIEFYYNGIKSNNWNRFNHDDCTIWRSPQKYLGSHEWQIKIKTNDE